MRITYGVASEGLGHAVRSGVVRDHLVSKGHQVTFACGKSRASAYLSKFGPVAQVPGLVLPKGLGAVARNIANAGLIGMSPLYLAGMPRPDLVISDFEPCTARYASLFNIPLLSIGNIEFISRCSHEIPDEDRAAAALSFPIVTNMVPDAFHYFVTTFADAPVRSKKTSLHAPILRPLPPTDIPQSDFVLVYFSYKADWNYIVSVLKQVNAYFVVYGSGLPSHERLDNVRIEPTPSDGFLVDLQICKAVIGGAGFSLMTECIYSHKPLLALPFEGHFEQILNANYLQKLGYGERCRELTPAGIQAFLSRAPSYAQNLSQVSHDQNVGLFSALDQVLGC